MHLSSPGQLAARACVPPMPSGYPADGPSSASQMSRMSTMPFGLPSSPTTGRCRSPALSATRTARQARTAPGYISTRRLPALGAPARSRRASGARGAICDAVSAPQAQLGAQSAACPGYSAARACGTGAGDRHARRRTHMAGLGLTLGTGGKSHPQKSAPLRSQHRRITASAGKSYRTEEQPFVLFRRLAPASAPGQRRPCQQPPPTATPDANRCAGSRMIAVAVICCCTGP
jgi:hypothetical protein